MASAWSIYTVTSVSVSAKLGSSPSCCMKLGEEAAWLQKSGPAVGFPCVQHTGLLKTQTEIRTDNCLSQ